MVEHKEMMYLDYNFLGSAERITFDKELSATEFFKRWGLRDGQFCQLRADENDRLVIEFVDTHLWDDDQWDAKQLDLF